MKRSIHTATVTVVFGIVALVIAGCSDSEGKRPISQTAIAPLVVPASKPMSNPQPRSDVTYKSAAKVGTVHKVIYKEGEYPIKPSWMTQRQWNSYIDWESNRMTKRETPRWDQDAKLVKLLRRRFGRRLREASTTKGSEASNPVSGWVAEVDIYSNRDKYDADMYVNQAAETLFASSLNINRVDVNICLHEEPVDSTIYSVQIDKGQEPKIVAEFDPSG